MPTKIHSFSLGFIQQYTKNLSHVQTIFSRKEPYLIGTPFADTQPEHHPGKNPRPADNHQKTLPRNYQTTLSIGKCPKPNRKMSI